MKNGPQEHGDGLKTLWRHDFALTAGVLPQDPNFVPREGYKSETIYEWPAILAAVSREKIMPMFTDLIDRMDAPEVRVVLETAHEDPRQEKFHELWRYRIDTPILKSHLWEFEEILLSDGCTGIGVQDVRMNHELQIDRHKLLGIISYELNRFLPVLRREEYDILHRPKLKTVNEVSHLHRTTEEYRRKFLTFMHTIGAAPMQARK